MLSLPEVQYKGSFKSQRQKLQLVYLRQEWLGQRRRPVELARLGKKQFRLEQALLPGEYFLAQLLGLAILPPPRQRKNSKFSTWAFCRQYWAQRLVLPVGLLKRLSPLPLAGITLAPSLAGFHHRGLRLHRRLKAQWGHRRHRKRRHRGLLLHHHGSLLAQHLWGRSL
jgi:hypothetical protein